MGMDQIQICLENKPVGILRRLSAGDLEFTYHESYVREEGSIPLSLSLPLGYAPFPSKITTPYFYAVMGDVDACFREGAPAIGAISYGAALPEPHALYTLIDMDAIPLATPMKQKLEDPVICLRDRQPIAPIALIEGEFYRPSHPLLATHCVKSEICIDDGNPNPPENLVANEIFMTLMAYNLGIPVPTIQRFLLDEERDTYALIMDRPDRSAPSSPDHLPVFQASECLSTALVAFGEITFGKLRVVDLDRPARQEIGPLFELIRQYGLKPALDFRTLLRTIFLCLIGGVDDFDLANQLVSLTPRGGQRGGCQILQMRDFLCSAPYQNTRKKFLFDVFGIASIQELTAAHVDDLARKARVNGRYLRSFALEQALFLPKIAREILQAYPSLENQTTIQILQCVERRSLLLHDLLTSKESRGERIQALLNP